MKIIKKRYWAFVLYPESAPNDWRDYIQQTGVEACVSPLHDKDLNPTGEPKKPHYHIILAFSGPTTYKNVCTSFTEPLGQPIPQPLDSIEGYFRYLTHKDNPDKFQYNEAEITTINGFDIKSFCELSYGEILEILKTLQNLICEHCFIEFSDLMDFLNNEEYKNLYDVAVHHTFFLNSYLTSYRNKLKNLDDGKHFKK